MSLVQFPGALAARHHPPPIEITRRIRRLTGRPVQRSAVYIPGIALHVAFGVVSGAVYAVAAPRRYREFTAVAFAGAIYGASYRGSLPMLGLHSHAEREDTRRQLTNGAAHLVYGVTLAEVLRWTDPKAVDDEEEPEASAQGRHHAA